MNIYLLKLIIELKRYLKINNKTIYTYIHLSITRIKNIISKQFVLNDILLETMY